MNNVDCQLCENIYGFYAVPLSSAHRPAAQMVLSGNVWELQTIEFMRAHAAGRDVVHAGTYFGDFLPALAAVADTVYAFEPNTENFHCAQWTVQLNRLRNVRLHHAALGDAAAVRYLQTVHDGYVLGGMSRIVDTPVGVVEDVDAMRLDAVLPADADIAVLQLDVEGSEHPALAGALSTIERCRPIIIVETVPQALVDSHLTGLGYRRVGEVCRNTVFQV